MRDLPGGSRSKAVEQTGKIVFMKQSSGWYAIQNKKCGYIVIETYDEDISLGDLITGDLEDEHKTLTLRNETKRKDFEAYILDSYLLLSVLRRNYGF